MSNDGYDEQEARLAEELWLKHAFIETVRRHKEKLRYLDDDDPARGHPHIIGFRMKKKDSAIPASSIVQGCFSRHQTIRYPLRSYLHDVLYRNLATVVHP